MALNFIHNVGDNYINIYNNCTIDLSPFKELPYKFKITRGKLVRSKEIDIPSAKRKQGNKISDKVQALPVTDYSEGSGLAWYLRKYIAPYSFVNQYHSVDWYKQDFKRKNTISLMEPILYSSWRMWEAYQLFPGLVELSKPVNSLFISNSIHISSVELYIFYRRLYGKEYLKDRYAYINTERKTADEEAFSKMHSRYKLDIINHDKFCNKIEGKYDHISQEIYFIIFDKDSNYNLLNEIKTAIVNIATLNYVVNNLNQGGSLLFVIRDTATLFTAQIIFILTKLFNQSYLTRLSADSPFTNYKKFIGIGYNPPSPEILKQIDTVYRAVLAIKNCSRNANFNTKMVKSFLTLPKGNPFYKAIQKLNTVLSNNIMYSNDIQI